MEREKTRTLQCSVKAEIRGSVVFKVLNTAENIKKFAK